VNRFAKSELTIENRRDIDEWQVSGKEVQEFGPAPLGFPNEGYFIGYIEKPVQDLEFQDLSIGTLDNKTIKVTMTVALATLGKGE
jgi:hypothetical protein